VEEELSYCSYGEAYEVNCARYGRESDLPIAHFKKRCCSPSGNLISDPNGEIRLQVVPLLSFTGLHDAPLLHDKFLYLLLPFSQQALGCCELTCRSWVQAYHEIEQRLVLETVFSQYMYKTLPTSNHLWAFKKQFCVQMALSGTQRAH
jgi:transformation/transcription domain-associated protein